MKLIMYHYVRPPCPELPYFRFLALEDFRRQLNYFGETFGFVDRAAFCDVVSGRAEAGPGVVLTFDDGVIDHYEHVLPELESRGLWGIFYVPTGMYTTGKMLDVHRIHCLLGRYGGVEMLTSARRMISDEMLSHAHRAEFRQATYARQDNDAATTEFKRLLNYYISYEYREAMLDELMSRHFDERQLLADYYVPVEKLADMHDRGMLVGGHSVNHLVFSKLDDDLQQREIGDCFDFLERAGAASEPRSFCYPYGGFHSFNDTTERLLAEAGCRFSVNVEPRDAETADFRQRPQALPRYDCNAFPHGQSHLQAAVAPTRG